MGRGKFVIEGVSQIVEVANLQAGLGAQGADEGGTGFGRMGDDGVSFSAVAGREQDDFLNLGAGTQLSEYTLTG